MGVTYLVGRNQSVFLDLFRILLLLQVIFGHAVALSIPNLSVLLQGGIKEYIFLVIRAMTCLGRESAFLFIFLSGFFVGGQLISKGKTFILAEAVRYRLIRLFPVMIIALLITVLADYVGLILFEFPIYTHNNIVSTALENFNLKVFIMNVFALQPTFSPSFGTNGPLWTLGYIIQFNLLAYIFRSFSDDKFIFFVSMMLFSMLVSVVNLEFALLLIVWVAGAFVYHHDEKILSHKPSWFITLLAFVLVSFAHFSNLIVSIILIPIVGALVIIVSKRAVQIKSIRILWLINAFSASSYATYAIHLPIIFILGGVLGITIKEHGNLSTWLFLLLTPLLSVIIGMFISMVVGIKLMKGR